MLHDARVDDTLWTGPRWRLLVFVNLPAARLEPALPSAGLELVLPAAAFSRTVEFSVVPPLDFLLE